MDTVRRYCVAYAQGTGMKLTLVLTMARKRYSLVGENEPAHRYHWLCPADRLEQLNCLSHTYDYHRDAIA